MLGIFSRHVGDAIHAASRQIPVHAIRKNKSRFSEYNDSVYNFIKHFYQFLKSDVQKEHFKRIVKVDLGIKKCSAVRFITFDTNALKMYPFFDEIVAFIKERNPDKAKEAEEPDMQLKLWILAVINQKIERPYLRMLEDKPGNIAFNFALVELFPIFDQIILDPTDFFFGTAQLFPAQYLNLADKQLIHPEIVSRGEIVETWLKPVLMAGFDALKTHSKDFLPGGAISKLNEDERARVGFVKATTNECESVFGLLTHLKHKYPGAKPSFLNSAAKVKRNKFSLADAEHVADHYPAVIPNLKSIAYDRKSWAGTINEGIDLEKEQEDQKERERLEKVKRAEEKLEALDAIEFVFCEKELKSLSVEKLRAQWKKHRLPGYSSLKKDQLISDLLAHIVGKSCLCINEPFPKCSKYRYEGMVEIWLIDIETNTSNSIMELAAIEFISGKYYSSLIKVPKKEVLESQSRQD